MATVTLGTVVKKYTGIAKALKILAINNGSYVNYAYKVNGKGLGYITYTPARLTAINAYLATLTPNGLINYILGGENGLPPITSPNAALANALINRVFNYGLKVRGN